MLEREPNTGEQKSSLKKGAKLMEKQFGYNWMAYQAVDLQEQFEERLTSEANERM